MLQRREFLEILSAVGLSHLLPGCGSGPGPLDAPSKGMGFSRSLLAGSQTEIGGDADGDEALSVIEGELPPDMLGHVLIVASVPDNPEFPLLAGEGIVYRISFAPKEARIKTRILRTDDYHVAQKVKGTKAEFGILFDIAQFSSTYGARNLANTALLPIMDGRLLATYDMGRPIEIDARSLHAITPVGLQDSWRPSLDQGLFTMHFVTAHPAYDVAERRVYAINYGLSVLTKFLRVVRWDGVGEPEFFDVIDASGKEVALSMLGHQMAITKHHVVILDGAFDVVGETPPTSSPILIIRKSTLVPGQKAVAQRIVIDRECTHFLADYDDAAGDRVRILLMHHNGTNTGSRLEQGDVGYRGEKPIDGQFFRSGSDRNVVGQHEIDVMSGRVTSKLMSNDNTWGVGLWGQDPRSWTKLGTAFYQSFGFNPAYLPKREAELYADYPFGASFSREVPIDALPESIIAPKLVHIDHESMRDLQAFHLDTYTLVSSPTFVPRKNRTSDDEGYLLVTVASDARDELWVFDATDLAQGPVCKLSHDKLDFPFTLHSTWMESLEPRAKGYAIDRREDYAARLAELDPDARTIAETALAIT